MVNGQRTGPYTAQDVRRMFDQGAIGRETQFWRDGMYSWEPIGPSVHLFGIPSPTRQQQTYQNPSFPPMPQGVIYQQAPIVLQPVIIGPSKSRVAYILLGLFLGGLGIHNFYAGYGGRGVAQLLLNLFLFWTIIVPIAIAIWVIIEVITVDRDGYGNRMT